MKKSVTEYNNPCSSPTSHAERCALPVEYASMCPECKTYLGYVYLEWQLPNTLREGEEIATVLKVIIRESENLSFKIENMRLQAAKSRYLEVEIEENPDHPLRYDTYFIPLRRLRGKARANLILTYDYVAKDGSREEIEESYPFHIENILAQTSHITNIAHHQVHVNDKGIYSGGDHHLNFKEKSTDESLPALKTQILLFKSRVRSWIIQQENPFLGSIKPSPFLALRFSNDSGCRLILDLRQAGQGPFTFGRRPPGQDPQRVLLRSYIPSTADYTYLSEPDHRGQPMALSGFSSEQFTVSLEPHGFVFTPLKELIPQGFQIVDAEFETNAAKIAAFEKNVAIKGLEKIDFSIMEFRRSTSSNQELPPLKLDFSLHFITQIQENSIFHDKVDQASHFLILNRKAHPENENREKLKTVILESWLDLDPTFGFPFLLIWDNGFFIIPKADLGKNLRIFHQSRWEDCPTEKPVPLQAGLNYQLGSFRISADTMP